MPELQPAISELFVQAVSAQLTGYQILHTLCAKFSGSRILHAASGKFVTTLS